MVYVGKKKSPISTVLLHFNIIRCFGSLFSGPNHGTWPSQKELQFPLYFPSLHRSKKTTTNVTTTSPKNHWNHFAAKLPTTHPSTTTTNTTLGPWGLAVKHLLLRTKPMRCAAKLWVSSTLSTTKRKQSRWPSATKQKVKSGIKFRKLWRADFLTGIRILSEFLTWDSVEGINLDFIFLAVDFVLMFLILVGLESGYIQRYWTEYVKGCACGRNSDDIVENE